MFKYFH